MTSALAGVYFGAELAKGNDRSGAGSNSKATQHEEAAPQFVAPDIIVYPLQSGNALNGYVVVRFAMIIGNEAAEVPLLQDEILLADAFYASMFSTRNFADAPDKLPEPDQITDLFLDEANRSAGSKRYEAALIQQFDVFEPDAVRRKNVRERKTLEPEPKAKPASPH